MTTALHVAFGTLALIAGPLALVLRKGGYRHRIVGLCFGFAVSVVLVTAGFMWQAMGHTFLVPLGFISGYLALHGLRAIARKRRRVPSRLHDGLDAFAACTALVAAASAIWIGADRSTELARSLSPALVGIGIIGGAFALGELLGFGSKRTKLGWLYSHLAAMIGTYVACVTAFIVINAHGVPMLLRWAVPGAIGAIAIVAYVLQYAIPAAVARATPRRSSSGISSSQAFTARAKHRRSGEVTIQAHGASSRSQGR